MTNVNVNIEPVNLPAINSNGYKLGLIKSATKAAQNDTWTVQNIRELISVVSVTTDSTGVIDPVTVSGKVITLTSANVGPASGLVIYR